MTPPHVLVIAYDFPPHAAIGTMRTLRVVRRLHATGWRVSVLTSDPAFFLPSTPTDKALLDQVPAGVEILRAGPARWWDAMFSSVKRAAQGPRPVQSESRSTGRGSKRQRRSGLLGWAAQAKDVVDAALSIPDREVGWIIPSFAAGAWHALAVARPDIIYSSAPPWTGQIVALGLRNFLKCPWVADFRDPWSRAPWRGDRYRFALRAAAVLERRVIRKADKVVFVARGNRDDFATFYGPDVAAKFHLVANGCDPTEFEGLERSEPSTGTHVMLHAGSLYAGRSPLLIFHAIAKALELGHLDRQRFRLRFLGTNAVSEDLLRVCHDLGIHDVVDFLPRVPRKDGLKAMISASSLLLLQPGHTVSVPGKVYEYLAAGRPILALAEGETAEVVRDSGVGVAVASDDGSSVMDALLEVVRKSEDGVTMASRETYDGNAGAAAIEQVLRETLRRVGATASRS